MLDNVNLIGVHGKINAGKDTVGEIIQKLTTPINLPDENGFVSRQIQISPFRIKKYADKLKEIACLLMGCTRKQLEDRDFKEIELGEECWYYTNTLFNDDKQLVPYLEAGKDLHNNTSWYIIKLTPRLLLQLLGTECGRQIIHPNIWINALFADYKRTVWTGFDIFDFSKTPAKSIHHHEGHIEHSMGEYPKWIITDVRFPNEAKAIKDRGGILIKVIRPETDILAGDYESETALANYKDWDLVLDNSRDINYLTEQLVVFFNNF